MTPYIHKLLGGEPRRGDPRFSRSRALDPLVSSGAAFALDRRIVHVRRRHERHVGGRVVGNLRCLRLLRVLLRKEAEHVGCAPRLCHALRMIRRQVLRFLGSRP